MLRGLSQLAAEVVPAGASAGAVGLVGTLAAAPAWLLALGQAVVVVIFTVRAIDKRMERLHVAVNETRGEVEMLRGRFRGLACMSGEPLPADCPAKRS